MEPITQSAQSKKTKQNKKKNDKQGQYSRPNCLLVHGLPENKTEKIDDVVISTISDH